MYRPIAVMMAAVLAAGHGSAHSLVPSVKVYKSRGAVQCESTGIPPTEMQRELTEAGIQVLSAACGTDGRMYPAMCGRPDDKINIFTIPKDQLPKALELSYKPLSNLPDASEIECP